MEMTGFPQAFRARESPPGVTMPVMPGRPSKRIARPPNRIQEIRKAKDVTLEQLGEACGKSDETVRKYETGDEGVSPTLFVLELIAKRLGIPPSFLLNDGPRGDIERAVVVLVRRLSPREQERVLDVLTRLYEQDDMIVGAR